MDFIKGEKVLIRSVNENWNGMGVNENHGRNVVR